MKLILFRIAYDVLLFILVFIAPWWLTLICLVAGIFFFELFFESFLFAYGLDLYYGLPGISFYGINLLFITIAAVTFLIAVFFKKRLRFYDR